MRANGVGMMKDYKAWAPMRGVREICLVRDARRIPVELFLTLLRPNRFILPGMFVGESRGSHSCAKNAQEWATHSFDEMYA